MENINTPIGITSITLLTLIVYFITIINVGKARYKYKIAPPAMTGDPNFERAVRVQQNMLEQLVFFLPLLWLFAYNISQLVATIIGIFWVLGRILYSLGYSQKAENRGLGFAISSLSSMILLLGILGMFGYSIYQYFSIPLS